MITTAIIVSLAFSWLAYETDWLRVRLAVGIIDTCQRKSWLELKPWHPNRQFPFWVRFPSVMSPLCGWDYILNTMHIIPEHKIELITDTAKYTIRSQSAKALGDAFRVYRNPYIKLNLGRPSYQELADNARLFATA